MGRTRPAVLLGFFVAVIAAMGWAGLAQGNLYVGKHEGDALHLIQIALRMADGQWPHLDFMTPIGIFAFVPIVAALDAGFGIGNAFLIGQILAALAVLPAVWWIAHSRYPGAAGFLFGALTLGLMLALVHGEAQRSVSISMHYNRWAWAIAFLCISAVLMPGRAGRAAGIADGLVIGLGMAVLALMKLTYFAAFAPVILLGLLLRRMGVAFITSVVAGLAVALAVTIFAGPAFWQAYIGDILTVAFSDVRPAPGAPLDAVVGAPEYLAGSLTLLLGVILLRHAKRDTEGLLLLLLAPGFFYVTYQNYGNDPQWLMLLAPILLASRPMETQMSPWNWDLRIAVPVASMVALALTAPSALNMLYSPFRHASLNTDRYVQLLPRAEEHGDVFGPSSRIYQPKTQMRLGVDGFTFDRYLATVTSKPGAVLMGEELPSCELTSGIAAWFDAVTRDLEQEGYGGARIFGADLFSSYWVFGDFKPLIQGTPWHYDGLPGIESADYVLVPICPTVEGARRVVLEALEAEIEAGLTLSEVRRTALYILLDTKPQVAAAMAR